jgi:hypothetical protein
MTDKDPLPKTTFQSFSEAFADEDRLGRFGVDKAAPQIVGATPVTNYPGAGNVDLVPTEPSLGLAVGDHPEPVGTYQEIQASINKLRAKPEDDPEAA